MDDIISKCKTFSQTNMSQMGSPDSSQCAAVYKRMHYDQLLTATYYFKRRKVHRGPRASVINQPNWHAFRSTLVMLRRYWRWAKGESFWASFSINLTLLIQHMSPVQWLSWRIACAFHASLKIPCNMYRNPYICITLLVMCFVILIFLVKFLINGAFQQNTKSVMVQWLYHMSSTRVFVYHYAVWLP